MSEGVSSIFLCDIRSLGDNLETPHAFLKGLHQTREKVSVITIRLERRLFGQVKIRQLELDPGLHRIDYIILQPEGTREFR